MNRFFSLSYFALLISGLSDLSVNRFSLYANKPQYETNYKAFKTEGADNQLHVKMGDKVEKTRAVLFSFDKSKDVFISSEAPLSEDVFLNIIWDNKVDTFITLTEEDDNNLVKLAILRDGVRVDLHYLQNLAKYKSSEFFITNPKVIEGIKGVLVLQSEILKGKEIRTIIQILCYNWEDENFPDKDTFDFIVEMANKHHKKNTPLFVNCFSGVGRVRFLISGLYAVQTKKDLNLISEDYFLKNYNKETIKNGEFLFNFRNKNSNYYLTLQNYGTEKTVFDNR